MIKVYFTAHPTRNEMDRTIFGSVFVFYMDYKLSCPILIFNFVNKRKIVLSNMLKISLMTLPFMLRKKRQCKRPTVCLKLKQYLYRDTSKHPQLRLSVCLYLG